MIRSRVLPPYIALFALGAALAIFLKYLCAEIDAGIPTLSFVAPLLEALRGWYGAYAPAVPQDYFLYALGSVLLLPLAAGLFFRKFSLPVSFIDSRVALVIPLILGGVLRFYSLAEYSPGFSGHCIEQFSSRDKFLQEPLLHGIVQWPLLSSDAQEELVREETAPGGFIEAIGYSFFGVTIGKTRILPALIGTFTIVLAYLCGAVLFDRRTGFWFAVLLAFAPWHITISRYDNTEHVLAPFHFLLCLWLTGRVLRSGQWRDYAYLGMALGGSIYVYATNQVVPGIVAIPIFIAELRRGQRLRSAAGKFLLLGVLCAAFASPQLLHNFSEGRFLPIRKNAYNNDLYHVSGIDAFWPHVKEGFQQVFVVPADPWLDVPVGAISWVEIFALAIGFLCLVRLLFLKPSRLSSFLLLLAFVVTPVPAVFGSAAPFRRLILFTTVIEFMAAVGLAAVSANLFRVVRSKSIDAVTTGAAAALLFCFSLATYFDRISTFDSLSFIWTRKLIEYVVTHNQELKDPWIVWVQRDDQAEVYRKLLHIDLYDHPLDFDKLQGVVFGADGLQRFVKDHARQNVTIITAAEDANALQKMPEIVNPAISWATLGARVKAYHMPEHDVAIVKIAL